MQLLKFKTPILCDWFFFARKILNSSSPSYLAVLISTTSTSYSRKLSQLHQSAKLFSSLNHLIFKSNACWRNRLTLQQKTARIRSHACAY